MTNNNHGDDIIKKILEHAKPDEAMMMEAIKKANATITVLYTQIRMAEQARDEMFVLLGTVLNKLGREVVIEDADVIPLDMHNYKVTTSEAVDMGDNKVRIIRLRHVSEEDDSGKNPR